MKKKIRAILIRGTAHPPSNFGKEYDGYDLRKEEIAVASEAIKGQAVLLEHKIGWGSIGVCTYAHVSKTGSLDVNLLITDQTPAGELAIDGIQEGRYRGLSLGQICREPNKDNGVVDKVTLYEVSICEVPARKNCDIHAFADNNGKLWVFENYENLLVDNSDDEEDASPQFLDSNASPEKLDLSSSRIQFEIPAILKERLLHPSLQEKKRKMTDTTEMIEPRLQGLIKRMKTSKEAFFDDFEATLDAQEKQQAEKQRAIEAKFNTRCVEYATKTGLDVEVLKGIDVNSKALICAAVEGIDKHEEARVLKNEQYKKSIEFQASKFDETVKENEQVKAENAELKEQLKTALSQKVHQTVTLPVQPANNLANHQHRFGSDVEQMVAVPAATVNQPQARVEPAALAAPPAGTPVHMAIKQRVSGLVPVYASASCWDEKVTNVAPSTKTTLKSFLAGSAGKDKRWGVEGLRNMQH